MKNALVVGGNSGIGLAMVDKLLKEGYEKIYIVGKELPDLTALSENSYYNENKIVAKKINLLIGDFSIFDEIQDISALVITAGFGRVARFEDLTEEEVINLIKVNTETCVRIIKKYYDIINSETDFYTAVMVSICGRVVSPLFSVYGATKGALRFFIENLNCELAVNGKRNRILEVSPGSVSGTSFNGGKTNLSSLKDFTDNLYLKMINRETLFIPQYNEIYKDVIKRYNEDAEKFGAESYEYKIRNGRLNDKPQVVVGYLSGTFDLFHIGHLNLIRKAKENCDYLIVSVHKSGAWKGKETFIPYEERCEIIASIKYVDKVAEDFKEDSDAWDKYHYDKLFVGSDYQGTERFNRYEEILKGKAQIIYFPYTKGTSSTQLRDALKKS